MRGLLTATAGLLIVTGAVAQEKKAAPAARHGVSADLATYAQSSAKEAVASILKAVERKRIDYLLAHLAEPTFVDAKVQELGGKFDELVREVTDHFNNDPKRADEFKRFMKEGTVEEAGTTAKVTLKDAPSRQVTLRQIEGRWYMNNDVEADKKK